MSFYAVVPNAMESPDEVINAVDLQDAYAHLRTYQSVGIPAHITVVSADGAFSAYHQ